MTQKATDEARKDELKANIATDATPKRVNDDSNPQQGTGSRTAAGMMTAQSQHRPGFKVPPTKKDSRKVFVGGLPSNGKFLTC